MFSFLIRISNATFPIAYWYLIIGMFYGLVNHFILVNRLKNQKIIEGLYPEVQKIKNKKLTEDETDNELAVLYKKHGYNAFKPVLLSLLSTVLGVFVIFPLIRVDSELLSIYEKSLSFLWIDNIFAKNISIYLPLLVTILSNINEISKIKLNKNSILSNVILIAISFAINVLMTRILSSAILVYSLGRGISNLATMKLKNKAKEKYAVEKDVITASKSTKISEGFKGLHEAISEIVDTTTDKGLEKFDKKFKNKNKKNSN